MLRKILIGSGAALLVLVAVWYFALLRGENTKLSSLRATEAAAQGQLGTLQGQYAALSARAKTMPAERKALGELERAVPPGPSLDQLLKVLNAAIIRSGMSLGSIGTPAPTGWGAAAGATAPTPAQGPQAISISLGVQGNDGQVLRLIRDLDNQPRLLVVNSFSLDSLPGLPSPVQGVAAGSENSYTLAVDAFYATGAANSPVFPGLPASRG